MGVDCFPAGRKKKYSVNGCFGGGDFAHKRGLEPLHLAISE